MKNTLTYKGTKIVDNGNTKITVKIRLNDECKNGHQDFAITAEGWNKRENSRWVESFGGACHDEILKYFPEFEIFIKLHLCTYKGVPLYAAENGFYHIKKQKMDTLEFCEYYRITSNQYDILEKSENILEYSILLKKIGVLEQWSQEAKKGIILLEQLTGETFLVDSKKDCLPIIDEQELKTFNERNESGYYSEQNKEKRAKEKKAIDKQNEIDKVEKEADEAIKKITKERDIKLYILSQGLPIDNFIFYNHTNKGVFNWLDYEKKINESQFKEFVKNNSFDEVIFEMK